MNEKLTQKVNDLESIIECNNIEIENLKEELKCSQCDFKADNLSKLVMHMEIGKHSENSKSFPCNDCDFTCQTESDLKKHKSSNHTVKFGEFKLSKNL